MDQNLLNYIKENLAKGVPQDQIRQSLITSGWQSTDIDAAFLQLNSQQQLKPPQISIKEQKSFFNPKILVAAIVLALLLTAGGGAYLFITKNKKVDSASGTGAQQESSLPQGVETDGEKSGLVAGEVQLSNCVKLNKSQLFPAKIGNYNEATPARIAENYSQGLYQNNQNKAEFLEIIIESTEEGQGEGLLQLQPMLAKDDSTLKELNKDNAFDIQTTQDSRLVYVALRQERANPLTGGPLVQEQAQVATFWENTNIELSFALKESGRSLPRTNQEYLTEVKTLFGQWVGQVCG